MKQHLFDFDRRARIGLAEAVMCEPKSAEQIQAILSDAKERNASLLLTRLGAAKAACLHDLDYDPASLTAYFGDPLPKDNSTPVAIVTGGTADMQVALECQRTLEFDGRTTFLLADIGVAGLWRLTSNLEKLKDYPVIIVVAGMDAALPTVLAGLVSSLVIAVPTSTGYGAARKGETALAACLSSCSSGLVVCNIDNGFGAACAAIRVLNQFASR